MKNKKLIIISHTEHFITKDGIVKGWGSTINEISFLADYWNEIVHVACLHKGFPPKSALPYTKENIKFVPIPPFGGKKIIDKLLIITKVPIIIYRVLKSINQASEVQLRLPTSIALFLLPLFSFFIPRKFTLWVKYAGNWKQQNAPISYRFQQFWLKKNIAKCKVTINGFWNNQPNHCFSFENPCLTEEDIQKGIKITQDKCFNEPFVFTFIGRLETPKGVDRIIEALKLIPNNKIKEVHFIGDGNKTDQYIEQAKFLGDKAEFHGFLSKNEIHEILVNSHFFLLPSTASEGFPKVIAEAACYGVIPIVSNVSSIPHYINHKNGFLWDINSCTSYSEVLLNAINCEKDMLLEKSINTLNIAKLFTFNNYLDKLKKNILN